MPAKTEAPESETTDTVAAKQDKPRTLDIKPCAICKRNVVNGRCNHCGYEPDREPRKRD